MSVSSPFVITVADDIDVSDHVRPTDSDRRPGVYRVVGTAEDTVTLLRVGDERGRRVHTGAVVTVDRDTLSGFESADNPDDGWAIVPLLAGLPTSSYWGLRTFLATLASHPIATAIAGSLFLVGSLEDPGIALPEPLSTVVFFAGAFGLAYVGSGRL